MIMTKSICKSALSPAALAAVLALLQGAPAQALNSKSFVSNSGSDANSCATVATACATFLHALDQTNAGGEITAVNTGEYGGAFINKSIHITNDGAGEAGDLVPSTFTGFVIAAGAGDVVSLRGIVIDGQGPGRGGINVTTASAVHVQNCVIRNLEYQTDPWGIDFGPSGNTKLFVSDTIIFNNGSAAATGGIRIRPTGSGSAVVVLDRVHLENNVLGLWADGSVNTGTGIRVLIRDSVVRGNASHGILATSAAGKSLALIVVERSSLVSNAGTGIRADGPRATILLNDNTITGNGAGIGATNSGQLIS